MLQQLREYATGWVAAILLGAIALSFVFFGIDFGTAGANVGLRINGEKVSRLEVDNYVRDNLNRLQRNAPDGLTPELERMVRARSVDQLINQKLLQQTARERGFRVTDDMVADAIRAVPEFQLEGRFDRQVYLDTLAANNRNVEAFEAQVRQSLQAQQIQEFFQQTAFVTTPEVREQMALLNQTRTIDYLRLPLSLTLPDVEVTEEDIQQRYENFAHLYTQPETVEVQYLELRLEDVAGEIDVDEAELREAYQAGLESGRFRTIEERRARHILVQKNDERTDEQARERAEELLARIENGESFEALARTESDDTLSGPDGGDLGWIAEGTLDDALVDAAFETPPGEVTGPVETSFGWHLLKVDEIRGGDTTSFEEAREQLLSQVRESRADGLFVDRGEQLAELVFQNAGSLEPAAQALGLELKTVAGVSRERGPAIASNAKVRDAIFSQPVLEEGLNSDVIELEFGHLVAVRLLDRTPARLRPLEEVRESIVSVVEVEKAREAVAELGRSVTEQVRAGTPLAQIAADLEVEIDPVMNYEVTRQSREVPTQLVTAVFDEPVTEADPASGTAGEEGTAAAPVDAGTEADTDTEAADEAAADGEEMIGPDAALVAEREALAVGGVSLVVGDYVVYRLTGVSSGELSPALGRQLRTQLEQQRAFTELAAWVEGLRAEADVFVARDLASATSPEP